MLVPSVCRASRGRGPNRRAPGGRLVNGELQGWQFRLDVIPAGLRIGANAPGGGDPAVWIVTR
jgi:hypothetical protein